MKPTPPELPGTPVLGHMLEFRQDRQALFRRGFDTLGPIFTIRLFNKPAVVLLNPEYQAQFYTQTDKNLNSSEAYKFLRAIFGEAALAAPTDVYYEQRPILYAPFKGEKMAAYIDVMQYEVQQWLDSLGKRGSFDLVSELANLVRNVAAHALMGKAFRDSLGDEFWAQYNILSKALDPILPPDLPLPKFRRRDQARDKLYKMIQEVIDERRSSPEKYDDFLQEFIQATYKDGRPAGDDLIIRLIMALMFAGHETTVGQTAWTIIHLLQNPVYLKLVRQDIADHLPPGTKIDKNVLNDLENIWWAVMETTRMHPSADMSMRVVDEEIEFGDYCVPRGWVVFTAAGTAHRLDDLFAKPDVFDPLRFAPGREEDHHHRFAMIGFGGGMHKCAGMNFANNEMMIITALLFQQYDLHLLGESPHVVYGMGAVRPSETTIRYRSRLVP